QPTVFYSPLLLVLVHGGKAGHPGLRRAEPVLPLRDKILALVQDADPHHVGGLHAIPGAGRVDRRSAARTERLQARMAAVGRGLEIAGRLPRHLERRAGHRDRDAERRARTRLTVRAMADRGLLRIGLALDRD